MGSLTILAWLVLGLAVAMVARIVFPGLERGGFLATLLLGMACAWLGGGMHNLLVGSANFLSSLLSAFLVSVVCLYVWRKRARIQI